MFAIAFDLVVVDTETHHSKGISQAYTEIGNTLQRFGFRRIQGSVYVADSENMANLFEAIAALKHWHGSRHPCGTFAHSASNSGPTLRPSSRNPEPESCPVGTVSASVQPS